MKVFVQHATDPAEAFTEIDSRDFGDVADRGEPPSDRTPVFRDKKEDEVIDFTGTEVTIDATKGFVFSVCIQGMTFAGDHLAVEHLAGSVRVFQWNDDPKDWTEDERQAQMWEFFPMGAKGIPDQRKTWYVSDATRADLEKKGILPQSTVDPDRKLRKVIVLPYSDFVAPDASITRHGIWVTDAVFRALHAKAAPEWKTWRGDPI